MPASDTDQLVLRARAPLFVRHRARLERIGACRMDPRVAARVDPSDVVQEAPVDAHRTLDRYLESEPLSFYPWLRQIVSQRLMKAHRFHRWSEGTTDREDAEARRPAGLPLSVDRRERSPRTSAA